MSNKRPVVWEDLVHDFLEIRSSLSLGERDYLIERLKAEDIRANKIASCTGFLIEGRLIVIQPEVKDTKFWVYHPKKRLIEKH